MDAAALFADLCAQYAGVTGVTGPEGSRRRFGSETLKVNNRIFAMLVDGRLVVKLPRDRVAALVGDGAGEPFGAGKGRPMKEWVVVVDGDAWPALAEEAFTFVGAKG